MFCGENLCVGVKISMSPKCKMTYFDLRGLGEPLRFIWSYGGIDFEEKRISFEEWPEIKKTMPYGKLPVVEIDGQLVHQSMAIGRYFAKQLKLTGDDDWEAMLCDMIVDCMADLRIQIVGYYYEPDEKIKESKKEILFKETIPYYLERLDAEVAKNDGHFVRGKLTWADLVAVAMIDVHEDQLEMSFSDKYPNLKIIKDKVMNIPQIKEWVEKRPKTRY